MLGNVVFGESQKLGKKKNNFRALLIRFERLCADLYYHKCGFYFGGEPELLLNIKKNV